MHVFQVNLIIYVSHILIHKVLHEQFQAFSHGVEISNDSATSLDDLKISSPQDHQLKLQPILLELETLKSWKKQRENKERRERKATKSDVQTMRTGCMCCSVT